MNNATTINWDDIKAGQTFGDAYGENEYTVTRKEYCRLTRQSIVWTTDLDGETRGLTVSQINHITRRGGFYNK